MTAPPKVSVIIASYNGERFVEETLRSVLDQTWRDLELVVVDDGSTDGTRAILKRVAAGDPRMRVVEKSNEGLIRTLNRAIAECRGSYIARLDHDDLALPTRIERQARFLDEHPECIGVGCLLQNIREDGSPMQAPRIRHEELQHRPGDFPPRQMWLYGPTPMIRADALRRVGGYREKFVAAEDRDLCWRLGEIGKLARLPDVLVAHRHHGSNMSLLKRRTQMYSALLSDLSAVAAHFALDDSSIVEAIDVGGVYGPTIQAYECLLAPHYPVDSYLLFFQMRWEVWDMPGFEGRRGMLKAIFKHLLHRPWDPIRYFLVKRAITYLGRKPRAPVEAGSPSTTALV